MNKLLYPAIILVISSLLFTTCVVQRSPVSGTKRAYGYSWEEEKKLGKQADQQIQEQYGIYQNGELSEYVKRIGHKTLQVSHMRREDTPQQYRQTEFTFRVLDSPVVNAFALPGGYVYVTRGLVAHLDNEAQLAVVLGHEIGHVAARHASQRAFEQKVGSVALLGGAILGQELLGLPGGDILGLGSQAAQFLFLNYSRDDERESDRLGVEYSARLEYEAAEGAAFFVSLERISENSGQGLPTFLSTHPDPEARAQTIPKLAEEWSEKGYRQTITHTDDYMNRLDNMIFGNNPREGFAREGVYYHPDLEFKFSFPTSWQLINQRSLVAVVNEDQDAVSIMRIDGDNNTSRASVLDFLNQEGVQSLGHSAEEHNGMQAYKATAAGQTDDGTKLGFHIYAVQYEGRIYRFIAYSEFSQFGTYKPVFEDIAAGFNEVTDPEILQIQPVRLQVFRADRTAPFESFLPRTLPMNITPGEVAILNQVQLEEKIEEGQYLKIPVR